MKTKGRKINGLYLALASLLLTVNAGSGQTKPREPHHFLEKFIGFNEKDFKNLDGGDVVVKIIDHDQKDEVAVFGIVWIDAPMNTFVRWQRDIEHFERGDAVDAVKKLSDPPRLEDFATLEFPEKDLDDIPKCELGDCNVKISEESLARIQKEVDWSAPDAHEQANRLIRQMLFEFVEEYKRNGDDALGVQRDKKRPTYVKKQFDSLLKASPYLVEYIPQLNQYLRDYPHAELAGAEDFFYWSKVRFGLKPMVRLNHVVIYPFGQSGAVAVGSKMLYASHYFYTALELKVLAKDTAHPDRNGFYLISLNRSRSDGMTGLFGGIVRSKAQSGAKDSLESALGYMRDVLEKHAGEASPQSSP